MRAVLDTGILIASLIARITSPDLIYQASRKKKFELITSGWQLTEFRRVSRYPKPRKYLVPSEAGNMINGLRYQARVLTDLPTLEVSQDPDDNPVLAMAVAGEADFLVSGDKRDLLSLKAIGMKKIVTARNFITKLQAR